MTDDITLGERLARIEGKVDAYSAGQSATLAEHARRLGEHDVAIDALRQTAGTHVTRDELADRLPQKAPTSVATWIGVVVAGVVGLGSLLTMLITLMRLIPDLP